MRNVAIIQARMGSSRLPGKVLKQLMGKPILTHVVTRVQAAQLIDEVVVATSTLAADDVIEEFCQQNGWHCIRGSETDVLSRYVVATLASQADIVIRVTSDCPLFSPLVLDAMLDQFDPANMDYMSTNFPARSFPVGLDCEVMRADVLLQAAEATADPYDREHVTPYIYGNPTLFSVHGYACDHDLQDIRITLDTQEDYDRLIALTAAHPELAEPEQDVLSIVQDYFQSA